MVGTGEDGLGVRFMVDCGFTQEFLFPGSTPVGVLGVFLPEGKNTKERKATAWSFLGRFPLLVTRESYQATKERHG
jgi:hypothetical protein